MSERETRRIVPRLSVLMPAKDAEATIEFAIISSLRAMPSDSELVVFNDGSGDSTFEVVDRIGDRRVRQIVSRDSIGVSGALNALLERTDSAYVARMDADDITLPWRFRLQEKVLSRGHEVVFGGVVHFGDGVLGVRPSRPRRLSSSSMRSALLLGNPVAHSTLFATRTVLETAGGYRACSAEDYDLWLRLATAGREMIKIATPIICYRHHGGQVTSDAGWHERAMAEARIRESLLLLEAAERGRGRLGYSGADGDTVLRTSDLRVNERHPRRRNVTKRRLLRWGTGNPPDEGKVL